MQVNYIIGFYKLFHVDIIIKTYFLSLDDTIVFKILTILLFVHEIHVFWLFTVAVFLVESLS